MVFSRSQTLVLALPILVLVGFCNTFYLMQVSTYLQQHVPDHLRGRVMSLYSLCWNLLPLGGLLAGALAAAVDARFAVLFGGLMVSANALAPHALQTPPRHLLIPSPPEGERVG